jgi:hypothetical protein
MIMSVCAIVGTALALFLRETAPIHLSPRPHLSSRQVLGV